MSIEQEVLELIIERTAQIFSKDVSELSADTAFAELGAKSADGVQVTMALEDEYDIQVPFMKFARAKTLGEAAEFVADLLA